MADPEPRLPPPYTEGPNASGEEQDVWNAAIRAFVVNLVIYKLSPDTTAATLFALFNEPQHQPLLYYYACAHLLYAVHEVGSGEHVALVAALFKLLKEEGLRRDDANGPGAFGNGIVFPTLRQLAGAFPTPPGYKDVPASGLELDPEYVENLADLAEYVRQHEAMVRLWALVGRLEADHSLGEPGGMSLLFHHGAGLLRALEEPGLRGVWETMWAAVGECRDEMAWGTWGTCSRPEWLAAFKEAAVTIARDERAPLVWRGRFAMIVEAFDKER